MKAIELTEEHKKKLLEMCNKLLKYDNFGFENGFSKYGLIEYYNGSWINWELIHWYELCDTSISVLLFPMKSYLWKEYLVKNMHPIDYLYEEFKKLQNDKETKQ